MNKYPNFIIEKIDLNDNSIYAFTSDNIGDKQQWRWFASNIISLYIPVYKNIKLYLFTSKKQLEKYLQYESVKEKNIPNDTIIAFKIYAEHNDNELIVWTDPLNKDGEKIIFNKKEMKIKTENSISFYDNIVETPQFIDLSFKTEYSSIGISSDNKLIHDMFISINKQEDERFYTMIASTYSNLFYEGETVEKIAKDIKIDALYSRFIFGEQQAIQKIIKIAKTKQSITEIVLLNAENIYTSFVGEEKYGKTTIKNNSIIIKPYSKDKYMYEYTPIFYYLPVDKEYFEGKGYKANIVTE